MFLQSITIIAVLFGCLEAKPVIYRNVSGEFTRNFFNFAILFYFSDCSITVDGILHYQGKHSFSKFEHECLAWTDLQTIYPDVINEPNFFNDASVKAAKNYCRNPNMNVNGPWCYIQDGDEIIAEECAVCQSLGMFKKSV